MGCFPNFAAQPNGVEQSSSIIVASPLASIWVTVGESWAGQ